MNPPEQPGRDGATLEVPSIAAELGQRFQAAGYQLYLVGGMLRDQFLGRVRDQPELDFATDAKPPEVLEVLRGWSQRQYIQGIRWGTVGCTKDGIHIEITTFRKEAYAEHDRHPTVDFATDIEADLSRRDFTVNAMAVSVPEGRFLDPFGGIRDLAGKRLDTPLDPAVSFGDDPLRMLRAARFASALDLRPVPGVVEAMRKMSDRLDIVSPERIQAELSALMISDRPSTGLRLIVETGLADRFLPELPALRLEQDPVHRHKDVLEHTFVVVERCEPDLRLRLAALLHDIGKPATRSFTSGGVQFHHHEVVGARLAEGRLRALRYPNDVIEDVVKLVAMHLRFHTYGMGWNDAAVRRYVRDASHLLDPLNQLVRADCTTRNPARAQALAALQDDLELRIARLAEEENLQSMRPPLDGNEVMEWLGLPPGPLVGEALRFLLEERIERGPISKDEAYLLLDRWAADHGIEPRR